VKRLIDATDLKFESRGKNIKYLKEVKKKKRSTRTTGIDKTYSIELTQLNNHQS
jgi:hypothetical protein